MKPKKYIKKQKFLNVEDVPLRIRGLQQITNGGNTIMEVNVNGTLYKCLVFHEPIRQERTLGFDDGNARGFHRVNRVRYEPMLVKIVYIFDNISMRQFMGDVDDWRNYGTQRNVSLVKYNSDGLNISTTHLIGCVLGNMFYTISGDDEPFLEITLDYEIYNTTYNNVTN